MGGRGASSSAVMTQSGVMANLSKNPLKYGKLDPALSQDVRDTVESVEKKHLKNKIEFGTCVDENGFIISVNKGGTGSVKVYTSNLDKANVFTHNHPRSEAGYLGGTFSVADMDGFATTNAKTYRASATEGTYSITKTGSFKSGEFLNYFKNVESIARQHYQMKNFNLQAGTSDYKQRKTDNFNAYLVELHNGLLDGRKKYGYTYTLEKGK